MNQQKDTQSILIGNSTYLNMYKIQDKQIKHASSFHTNQERQSVFSKQDSQESFTNSSQKFLGGSNNFNKTIHLSDLKYHPEWLQSNMGLSIKQNSSNFKSHLKSKSLIQNANLQNDSQKKDLRSIIGLSYEATEGFENICEQAITKSKLDQLKFNSNTSQNLMKTIKSDIEKQSKVEFQQNFQKKCQNSGIITSNNDPLAPIKQKYISQSQFNQTGGVRNMYQGVKGRGSHSLHKLNKSDVGQVQAHIIENKSQILQSQELFIRDKKLGRNIIRNNSNTLKKNDWQIGTPSELSLNYNNFYGYIQNNYDHKNKRIRRQSNHDGTSKHDITNKSRIQLNQTYNNNMNSSMNNTIQEQVLQPYNKNQIAAFISKDNSTMVNKSIHLMNSLRKKTYNLVEKKSFYYEDKSTINYIDKKTENLQDQKINKNVEEKPIDIKTKSHGRIQSMGPTCQQNFSLDLDQRNKQNTFSYTNNLISPREQKSLDLTKPQNQLQNIENCIQEQKQKQYQAFNPQQQILVSQFLREQTVDSKDWPKLRQKIYYTLQMKAFNKDSQNMENKQKISDDIQQESNKKGYIKDNENNQFLNEGEKTSSLRQQSDESQIQQFHQNLLNSIIKNKDASLQQIQQSTQKSKNQNFINQQKEDEGKYQIQQEQLKDNKYESNINQIDCIKENNDRYNTPQTIKKKQVFKLDFNKLNQGEQQLSEKKNKIQKEELQIKSERNYSQSDVKQTLNQSPMKSARYSNDQERDKSPANSSYFKGSTVVTDNFKESFKKSYNKNSTPNESNIKKLENLQTTMKMNTPNSRKIPFKDKVSTHNEMNFMKYSVLSDFENQVSSSRNQQLQPDKTQNSVFMNSTSKSNVFRHEIMNSLCLTQLKKIKKKVTEVERERFKSFFNEIINNQNLLKYQKDLTLEQIAPEYKLHQIKYIPRGNQDIFENKSLRKVYKERNLKEQPTENEGQVSTLQKALNEKVEQKKNEEMTVTRREYHEDKNIVYSKEQNLKQEIKELVNDQIQQRQQDQKCYHKIDIENILSPNSKKHFDFTQYQASKWYSFRHALIQFIEKITRLKLQMDIEKIFSRVPFSRPHSEEFFEYVKNDKHLQVVQLLISDKYLVYSFDNGFNTPLQWACKRGHTKIAQVLIEYNSDIDHRNEVNKTALYYACSSNDLTTAVLLLKNRANPWSQGKCSLNQFIDNFQTDKKLFQAAKRGKQVKVKLNNHTEGQGVLYTIHPKSGGVIIKNYEQICNAYPGEEGYVNNSSQDKQQTTKCFNRNDFVYIFAENVDDPPFIQDYQNLKSNKAIKTDGELTKMDKNRGRQFQAVDFIFGQSGSGTLEDEEELNSKAKSSNYEKLDQFEINQKKFGVGTDFKDEYYTTKLDISKLDKQQIEFAEKLEQEVAKEGSKNKHVLIDRGRDDLINDSDEEKHFSAVHGDKYYTLFKCSGRYTEEGNVQRSQKKADQSSSSSNKGQKEEDAGINFRKEKFSFNKGGQSKAQTSSQTTINDTPQKSAQEEPSKQESKIETQQASQEDKKSTTGSEQTTNQQTIPNPSNNQNEKKEQANQEVQQVKQQTEQQNNSKQQNLQFVEKQEPTTEKQEATTSTEQVTKLDDKKTQQQQDNSTTQSENKPKENGTQDTSQATTPTASAAPPKKKLQLKKNNNIESFNPLQEDPPSQATQPADTSNTIGIDNTQPQYQNQFQMNYPQQYQQQQYPYQQYGYPQHVYPNMVPYPPQAQGVFMQPGYGFQPPPMVPMQPMGQMNFNPNFKQTQNQNQQKKNFSSNTQQPFNPEQR